MAAANGGESATTFPRESSDESDLFGGLGLDEEFGGRVESLCPSCVSMFSGCAERSVGVERV